MRIYFSLEIFLFLREKESVNTKNVYCCIFSDRIVIDLNFYLIYRVSKKGEIKGRKFENVGEHDASGSISAQACTQIDERHVHSHTDTRQ